MKRMMSGDLAASVVSTPWFPGRSPSGFGAYIVRRVFGLGPSVLFYYKSGFLFVPVWPGGGIAAICAASGLVGRLTVRFYLQGS